MRIVAGDFGARGGDRLDRLDLGDQHFAVAARFAPKPGKLAALMPFDQHAHRAVGQLQQLQHRGDDAGIVEIVAVGIVAAGIELGEQEDVLLPGHRGLKRGDRFLAADEQRHDHAGEHDNVAQGKQGKFRTRFHWHFRSHGRAGRCLGAGYGVPARRCNGACVAGLWTGA